MTYAQAANRETCPGCSQPVETYSTVIGENGVAVIGWCLDCVEIRFLGATDITAQLEGLQ